ncbi:MAG: non-heme iron oxygenase ferredoxin subunit [Planctomycetes bacterium]|nr:non-heme iron oxygenase ferredoxin subunit [Planctomycetota bacterium]
MRSRDGLVRVAGLGEIPDPGRRTIELGDHIAVLFHVGGEYYCIDDVCTHDGGPLGHGSRDGFAIVCPRHGAKFDIRTGKALTMPATVDTPTHEVEVTEDGVFVRCEA